MGETKCRKLQTFKKENKQALQIGNTLLYRIILIRTEHLIYRKTV